MKSLTLYLGILMFAAGCEDSTTAPTMDRDNTGVNERDANNDTTTPMDQSNDQSDIDLVAKIRSEVLEIDDLSTSGRNVKIITEGQKVTLRGPVASEAEREAILKTAQGIAGAGNIDNQLEVEAE